jgi:Glucodextranase, domain B
MPTRGLSPRRCGARLVAFAAALAGVAALAPAAEAAITESAVTSPADGTLMFQSRASEPSKTFTVEGTTNGTTGDSVDIDCYQGASSVGGYTTGIAVAANGSFSAAVPESALPVNTCHLLAVSHGANPEPGTAYTGPRVGFSGLVPRTLESGPNAGDVFGFMFGDQTMSAQAYVDSIDECGPATTLPDGTSAVNVSGYILDCAGSFYNAPEEFFATKELDLNRSEIQVDGQNAYGSDSAAGLFNVDSTEKGEGKKASTELEGFPSLHVRTDSFNSSTGEAQVSDEEPLVKCAPEDPYAPTAANCTEFASTGVLLTRVTHFIDAGRAAIVTDTYASSDGHAHALDLLYETDLEGATDGWMLPGENAFRARETGETGAAPPAAESVFGIVDPAQPPSFTNLVGALTFANSYYSVRFDNTLWPEYPERSALFEYRRTVPAAGSTSITWSYATGTSLAEVQADADQVQPPAIAIAGPPTGTIVGTPTVTVTGTASAGSGISSVTVNGVAASLSGGTYSATVPLAAGTNPLVARVTSRAGGTASAQVFVAYSPPGAPSSSPQRPVVSHTQQSARRWREGGALPRISRARRKSTPIGTTFSFTLNERAEVQLAFTQPVSGRKVAGRCVAPSPRNRHGRRCTRTLTAGTLPLSGHAGVNTVRFAGRLSRSKRLKPGRHTVLITATNTVGQSSAPQRLTFTIVR